jgi:hypothetical protein
MIKFIEHTEPGYAARTIANAKAADLTMAFAVDFETPGERLTKKAAGKNYLPIPIQSDLNISDEIWYEITDKVFDRFVNEINIAGNGIYSLPFSQEQIDDYLFRFIAGFLEIFTKDFKWRNGGQTGIDEASGKAVARWDMPVTILASKNWLFRDINGKDHMRDPDAFCSRFGEQYVNNI